MSAYLAFSNSRRADVKRSNPKASNGEISKLLSIMWKEAPEELKRPYIDAEIEHWDTYRKDMTEWREKHEELENEQARKAYLAKRELAAAAETDAEQLQTSIARKQLHEASVILGRARMAPLMQLTDAAVGNAHSVASVPQERMTMMRSAGPAANNSPVASVPVHLNSPHHCQAAQRLALLGGISAPTRNQTTWFPSDNQRILADRFSYETVLDLRTLQPSRRIVVDQELDQLQLMLALLRRSR